MPSKRPAPVIGTSKDGGVVFQYSPTETGIHEMNVTYNEKTTDGSPFRCHVDNSSGKLVTAYGDGLNFAESGKETTFSVCGASCDVSINGPSKTDVTKKSSSGSISTYSYVPLSPGEYMISIKSKGKEIHGSPFSSKVSGEGRKRCQLSITSTSEVNIGAKDIDLANATAILKTPSGSSEPCLLKKMADGSIGIASFTPKSKGGYKVEITESGKAVKGSPFTVNVGDGQVCASTKVKASGAIKDAKANVQNTINLDASAAGYGNLGVSIEGPHRSDVNSEGKDGHFVINYKPHEPGLYLCNIKYGDDHITGSPFMLSVGGQASGRIRETVTKAIAECSPAGPGSKCEFQLKIPGTDPLDMEAALTAPNGKTELCDIMDLEHDLYDIKFKPEMDGVHTVSLKQKGLHIAGSPFQYTVGPLPKAGPHKVEIGGPGLEQGEVGANNAFNIYTREAGGGELSLAVEGPSKAVLDVVDRGHGYTTVSYKVTQDGDYGIHVKYNGEHVPDSPSTVYISPHSADAKMCSVHGIRDRGLELGKHITFNVNKNGAKGDIRAFCDMPGGTEEDVFLQELDSQLYALRLLPKENGIHYVHVKLNEAHIPGSPFPMLVGKLGSDPALVMANGDGLAKAESGKVAKINVVTTDSGSGPLNVTIEGPSKVAIQCKEVDTGYEFSYTAMAPGDYLITIKYCNITIAGCPTKAVITGQGKASDITEQSSLMVETVEKKPGAVTKKRFVGDASKVVAKGNGLKKAFPNRPANFTLDCKDAGQGLMMIGILSPTGNPLEEISTKRTRPTSYQCNYKTKEKGEHILTVRWGTDDIPGSPFTITV